jgi:hypothetical protein
MNSWPKSTQGFTAILVESKPKDIITQTQRLVNTSNCRNYGCCKVTLASAELKLPQPVDLPRSGGVHPAEFRSWFRATAPTPGC